jgi:hypothetical protein
MEPPEPKQIDRAHLLYIINYDLCRGEDQTGMNPSPEIPKNIKRTDCLTTLSYWGWKRSLWVVPQHSSIEHCQLQTFPFVQVPAEYHRQIWQEHYIYACWIMQG